MNIETTSLLLTRPRTAARRFLAQVEQAIGRFAFTVVSPLQEIVPKADIPDLETVAELVFTSENAVAAMEARPVMSGARAWCVGQRTARRAREAGLRIGAVAEDVTSLAGIIERDRPQGAILHLAGTHRRGDLVGRLRAADLAAECVVVYEQKPVAPNLEAKRLLGQPGHVIAPVFSPRSTCLLVEAARGRRARVHLAAISANAACDWSPGDGEVVAVAPTPDAQGVIAAMGSLFDADPSA